MLAIVSAQVVPIESATTKRGSAQRPSNAPQTFENQMAEAARFERAYRRQGREIRAGVARSARDPCREIRVPRDPCRAGVSGFPAKLPEMHPPRMHRPCRIA